MAKKERYCPSCGNKTNDYACDICGRNTKSMKDKTSEEMLHIIDDDMEDGSFKQDFTGDHGNRESTAYHKDKKDSKLHFETGGHPYFEHRKKTQQNVNVSRVISIIAPIVVVIIFCGVLFGINVDSEFNSEDEVYLDESDSNMFTEDLTSTLENHTIFVEKNIPIHTSTKKIGETTYIVMKNDSIYHVVGELTHSDMVDEVTIAPNSSVNLEIADNETYQFASTNVFYFDFDRIDIDYTYQETRSMQGDVSGIMTIDKDISMKELETIGRQMFAYNEYRIGNDMNIKIIKKDKQKTELYRLKLQSETNTYSIVQVKGKEASFEKTVQYS